MNDAGFAFHESNLELYFLSERRKGGRYVSLLRLING